MDISALLLQAREGNREAREKLICENTGLVYSIVKRFLGRGQEMEDLVQIGNIGLIKAIDKFDLSFEVQFSTYAVPMIVGEIKRFLRDDGMLKVSRTTKENARKIYRLKEEIENQEGREPSLTELADRLEMNYEDVAVAVSACAEVESLYQTVYSGSDGSDICLMDRVEQAGQFDEEILSKMALSKVMESLTERERTIIIRRYYEEKTQTEIAKELGVSQVQVSRLEKKILCNMRRLLTS